LPGKSTGKAPSLPIVDLTHCVQFIATPGTGYLQTSPERFALGFLLVQARSAPVAEPSADHPATPTTWLRAAQVVARSFTLCHPPVAGLRPFLAGAQSK
jgi:hypothetical protein